MNLKEERRQNREVFFNNKDMVEYYLYQVKDQRRKRLKIESIFEIRK